MKIAVDISQVVFEGTGVARYTRNLIEALLSNDTGREYTFFFSSLRRSIPSDIKASITKKHKLISVKIPPTVLDVLWNQLHILSIDVFVGKQDVVISSDWTQPPTSAKRVTVVHDLVYLRHPETVHPKIVSVQKRRLKLVEKEVDVIIADSKSTKQDLVDLLHIDAKKIHVVYPAAELSPSTINFKPPSTNYILTVGKLEPRKNIARLISAFQKANLRDVELLIVGPDGWEVTGGATGGRVERGERQAPSPVKFLGFVKDANLYHLYKNALFFIYPSLYEGFGYPVAEAMALGCPVATSNTSSLKEIAEGSALLFDPTSEEEITNSIIQLAKDESLRKNLSEKGKRRATDFSQKNFINHFLDAL